MKKICVVATLAALLAGCGGGGSSDGSTGATQQRGGPAATIFGKITFDLVPVALNRGGSQLDNANIIRQPARSIAVALIGGSTGAELAATKTDAAGDYALVGPAGP